MLSVIIGFYPRILVIYKDNVYNNSKLNATYE